MNTIFTIENPKEFGKRIVKFKKEMYLTQDDFSELMNIPYKLVESWIDCKATPEGSKAELLNNLMIKNGY